MADMFAFLQNPYILYPLMVLIAAVFIIKMMSPKKDEAKDMLLKQIAMDYGRKEIRKHTIKELDSISHLFLKYNKPIYRQGYDGEIKVGTSSRVQDLMLPDNMVIEYDSKGKPKKVWKDSENYIKDAKCMLIQYKTPMIDFLDFFPLSIIVTDILGSKHYMMILDKNILYHNKKKMMLNVTEFTSQFDIIMPVDNMDVLLPKIKDLVQKGFNEELMGRMETLPSNVAQLHLQHTEALSIEEKRAETTARILDSQKQQLRSM